MPGVLASSTERVLGTPLAPEARTLPMLLRDAGYATAGVSANPFVSAHYGYARGFDRFSDPSDAPTFLIGSMLQLLLGVDRGMTYRLGLAGSDSFYEPAERVFARGLRVLEADPKPSFLYLHTMDVHGPYLPPHRFLPPGYRPGDYVGYSRFLRLSRDDSGRIPARAHERTPATPRAYATQTRRSRPAQSLEASDAGTRRWCGSPPITARPGDTALRDTDRLARPVLIHATAACCRAHGRSTGPDRGARIALRRPADHARARETPATAGCVRG
jgi:arylsulfatase A-like enzyme